MKKIVLITLFLGWLFINVTASAYFVLNAEKDVNDCMNTYISSGAGEGYLYKTGRNSFHIDTKELDFPVIGKAEGCYFYGDDIKYGYKFILNSLHCGVANVIL